MPSKNPAGERAVGLCGLRNAPLKGHRNERAIRDWLKQVAHERHAVIAKWRIAEAYGQAIFSITIRRDLRERWDALLDEYEWNEKPALRMGWVNADIVLTLASDYYDEAE